MNIEQLLSSDFCYVCDSYDCTADAFDTDHDFPSIEDLTDIDEYV